MVNMSSLPDINLAKLKDKKTWFGELDYKYLCTPSWPFCTTQQRRSPAFFGKDENLGFITALFMGLQHALAMTGGLITPPLLIGFATNDTAIQAYLIQAAMLVCSITTFIQVLGPRIPKLPMLGTGILSVMGVSFASVSIFQQSIAAMMKDGSSFSDAYGRMLGTCATCCIIPVLVSCVPYRYLQRVFPPVVLGTTVMLIGINLTGTGMLNWGGGNFCGTNYQHLPATFDCMVGSGASGAMVHSTCFDAGIIPMCSDNGFVKLPFGSGSYVGMGFLVFVTIITVEVFGSPFMRNASVVIGLIFGYIMAVIIPGSDGNHFIDTAKINSAPVVTFLWTTTFKWGVYTPAFIPLIIVFLITSIETMGDVSATEEASQLETTGPVHASRIKGGLLNDWFSSFFSAISGSMPLTTFAQNNGVISLTGVASRQAGFACALWLLFLGIFGKFGGWVLSIPACVLGGMTTFLFANVISSGVKILVSHGPITRRDRFILACSLGLGIGVTIVPQWATNHLWPVNSSYSEGLASIQQAVLSVLSTPFCLGTVVALILNLVIPADAAGALSSLHVADSKHIPLFDKMDVDSPSGSNLEEQERTSSMDSARVSRTNRVTPTNIIPRVEDDDRYTPTHDALAIFVPPAQASVAVTPNAPTTHTMV